MATAGAVFEVFDVGLYLDKDSIGIAPRWELNTEAFDLWECQRYWEQGDAAIDAYVTSGAPYSTTLPFTVTKRDIPTIAQTNTGVASRFPNTPSSNPATISSFKSFRTANATGNGGYNETWTASARM